MPSGRLVHASLIAIALSLCAVIQIDAQTGAGAVDRAFARFWAAKSPEEAAKAIDAIVKTRVTFNETLRRLKKGRPYTRQKSGVFQLVNRIDGVDHRYAIYVPPGYDPSRRYPVRVHLHGDVGGAMRSVSEAAIEPFLNPEFFSVVPFAWNDAPWWTDTQVLNLRTILDRLKRQYNIDENRIVLAGESDGGTGAYYFGMRDTTPFAAFLPFNAFIMVLGNQGLALNERLFPNNLRNKPMFVVNGGKDPLYPTEKVDSYIDHMKRNGVAIDYRPQPEAGHDIGWWPTLKADIEKFATEKVRNPVPDSITWETADEGAGSRAHWLIIDELNPPGDEDQAPSNDQGRFTPRRAGANPFPLFAYQPPAGRVDVVRRGNSIEATAEGVAEVTLLLSPDRIDFTKPVTIRVNDMIVFQDEMIPNVGMLLKWAAKDNDRTMLFAAEFHVHLEN
jgi:acetyl esterase/lipase